MNTSHPIPNLPKTAGSVPSPLRLLPKPKPRVLLADDDRGIRESLGKLLHRANCDVIFAAHGGQVLELALNEPFDLLLLDLNMPLMDGWDALDHLAVMKPTLPIIVITAQPDQREWVTTGGAHALLEKPLDLSLLLQTIEDFLHKPPVPPSDRSLVKRERFRHGWPRRHGQGPEEFAPSVVTKGRVASKPS